MRKNTIFLLRDIILDCMSTSNLKLQFIETYYWLVKICVFWYVAVKQWQTLSWISVSSEKGGHTEEQQYNNIYFWTGEKERNFRRSSIKAEWQEQPIDGCLFTQTYRCVPQTADIEILPSNKALLGYLFCWFNSEMYFELRAESVLYLILPSWLLALDRGCRAMKSSPIATRLEYIYSRRTHRADRRKNTQTHTEVRYQTLTHIRTEPTLRIIQRQSQTGTKTKVRAEQETAHRTVKAVPLCLRNKRRVLKGGRQRHEQSPAERNDTVTAGICREVTMHICGCVYCV